MSVGVMKDYKLKQRNLRASHTLGKDMNADYTLSVDAEPMFITRLCLQSCKKKNEIFLFQFDTNR
jgi:hypothetical protein